MTSFQHELGVEADNMYRRDRAAQQRPLLPAREHHLPRLHRRRGSRISTGQH